MPNPLLSKWNRLKTSGSVKIRSFESPYSETVAAISNGKLRESLADIAKRIGFITPGEALPSDTYFILVDERGLIVINKLIDNCIYYVSCAADSAVASDNNVVVSGTESDCIHLPPDTPVAWFFDTRMLNHKPDTHRSPETPYRLERAVEMLQGCARAGELLPPELLVSFRQHSLPSSHTSCSLERKVCLASFIAPRLATKAEICSFHDPSVYNAFVENGNALDNLGSDVYCNEQTSSIAARLSAAAVIDAGDLVLKSVSFMRQHSYRLPTAEHPMASFCLVRPPGHHCTSDQPRGFCLVNNVAIASKQLLQRSYTLDDVTAAARGPRIAILDLDVHYGEGTESFVESYKHNASGSFPLLYLSLHRYDHGKFYPFDLHADSSFKGEKSPGSVCNVAVNTNAHVPEHCEEVISDFLVRDVVNDVFLPRLDTFRPDLLFVSLGFDAAYSDPLGKMAVEGGFAQTVAALKRWCMPRDSMRRTNNYNGTCTNPVGLVLVLEGGYNPESVAQGVLSAAYALTYPMDDVDVRQFIKARIPRTWGDVRQRQSRRLREWEEKLKEKNATLQTASNGGSALTDDGVAPCMDGGKPTLVEDDSTLTEKHLRWCRSLIMKVRELHDA